MKSSFISLIALAALPLVSFAAQPAGAATTPFGGTAIPGGSQSTSYVISKSGSYYLAGDRLMTADVSAITVNVPDVTIDLNGCAVSFTAGSTANGIDIPAVSNVEIRNGSINDVPGNAINAIGGNGLRIIDVRVTTAGKNGVYSTAGLTRVDRSDFSYCGQFGVYIFSISTNAAQVTNTVSVQNGQCGIFVGACRGSEVSGCRVQKNQQSGIVTNGEGCMVSNNTVYSNNVANNSTGGGIVLGSWSTARGNIVTANGINGIYVGDNGCTLEANIITISHSANGGYGNAINVNYGSAIYANNRISSYGASLVGTLVNGGGNFVF